MDIVKANRGVLMPNQVVAVVAKPAIDGQESGTLVGQPVVSDQNHVAAQDPWPEVVPFDPTAIDVPEPALAEPTARPGDADQTGATEAALDAEHRQAGSKASWRAFRMSSKHNAKGWAKFKLAGKRVELRQRTTVLEQRIGKFNQRINAFRGEAARARAAGNGQGAAALESLVTSAQVEVGALGRVRDQFGAEMSQIIGDERAMG